MRSLNNRQNKVFQLKTAGFINKSIQFKKAKRVNKLDRRIK